MRFTSIRQKLIVYFLVIILTLTSVSVVFGVFHLVIVNKYQEIENNIFLQYSLINSTKEIITNYNDYRNAPIPDNLEKYSTIHKNIIDTISILKQEIVNDDSRQLLVIVENTIKNILAETDEGIKNIKENDILNTSLHYSEANRKFDFVKENTGNLILNEIDYSRVLEQSIQKIHKLIIILGGILFLIIIFSSVALSIFWARKLVSPLIEIILTAKAIAGGNLETHIHEKLLNRKDEIGDLTNAFNDMTIKLKDSRAKLEAQIKEIEESKLAILNLMKDLETEKKKVEQKVVERTQELSNEKARLFASINSLSFSFIIVDMNNNIILKNKAFTELFSIKDADQFSVKDISKSLGGFDIEAEASRCMQGQTVCEIKEIIFNKKILRGIVAPISVLSGKIGYVLLFEDITEAKVLERSRDEFFAVASHELRTPLTAIRGNTEIILDMYADKVTDKDVQEMLRDIQQGSLRLIHIVNDFLEVSRLEQGRIVLKKTSFDIIELINKTIKVIKPEADKKNLKIEGIVPIPDFPMIYTDEDKVEQILFNLIGNAIKFTKEGSVSVSIEKIGDFAKIKVIDTGLGISKQNESLLFRKFQPAGEQTLARDVSKSTGLGLYISSLLISKMGGTIGLEKSEVGKGSTFAFTLPFNA
ncbi:MAG: ATP-binding protein [Candidatus Paceibacterota bacterium]